jgi:predicted RND superfamily exporter protein
MRHKLYSKKYRYFFIIVPIVLLIILVFQLQYVKINPDLNEYLPTETESRINITKIEEEFGIYDPIIIVFKSEDITQKEVIEKLKQIHDSITDCNYFDDIISIFNTKNIKSEDDFMLVEETVQEIPQTKEDENRLKENIKSNSLVYKLMVSENFNYTIFIINPTSGYQDSEIIEKIQEIVTNIWGENDFYLSGMPYLRDEIQKNISRDITFIMPLAIILMISFLYFSFREKRGIILPLLVVIISTGVAMGLMPLLGFEYSLITILTPVLMISIANNYGVHIIAKYQEINATHPEYDMKTIVYKSMKDLSWPILLTGLTTIAGISGLLVHIMLPAVQMGIITSIGIAFALLLSLLFLPSILIGLKKGKPQKNISGQKKGFINKILNSASELVTKKPKLVIILFTAFFILAGIGIFRLDVSINNENVLPKSHSIRKSTEIINNNFGGTKTISVLFEGDVKSPELINDIKKLEVKLNELPQMGSITSISDVILLISKSINTPDEEAYDKIPDSRNAIAQYIEFYNMNGDPDDFENFVDFNYTKALVNIQFRANDIKEFNQVANSIQEFCNKSEFASFGAGICLVEKDMADSIVKGQIYSLMLAFGAILILLWIIFKSFRTGLLGCIPLVFTIVCNFGIMGWLGIELDIATSLLTSVAIGVGVDYTIHLFWRIKTEIANGKDIKEASTICLQTTGRGIAINAFSVMLGFSVLFISGILILKTFAFLIIFSLLLCLLCAILLIPAILINTNYKLNTIKK